MAKNQSPSGQKVRKEFTKKISAGKVLCSEINKATSNAMFLYMHRHDTFVSQLESAKHSMLVENGRRQNDVQRKLDRYKHRKRIIFREKVLSRGGETTPTDDDIPDDNEEEVQGKGEGVLSSASHWLQPSATSQESSSRGSTKSRDAMSRRRSSSYSISLHPPSGASSKSDSSVFPAILKVPMAEGDTVHINTTIQRQLRQHMCRQEGLQAQILRSRVHDFCSELDSKRGLNPHGGSRRRPPPRFCVTSSCSSSISASAKTASRRFAFSEGETSTHPATTTTSSTTSTTHSAKSRRVVTTSKRES